jgi:CRISPR/Cas system CSM-associated protein Csm3 (group 7 of RAMP superfamily)
LRTERITIGYRLTFESAFHFGTGLRGGLVDRLVARDTEGFLYVPGSTLKGALRERCEQLAELFNLQATSPHIEAWREANRQDPDIVARIFGTRFLPGRVYFDDAQMVEEDRALFEVDGEERKAEFRAWQTEQRTQVAISRRTRTAQHGMLYTSEYGVCNLHFEGQIIGVLKGTPLFDSTVGTFPLLLLIAGLLSLGRVGGNKSSGAGKLTCEIREQEISIDDNELALKTLLEELPYFGLYKDWREEVVE